MSCNEFDEFERDMSKIRHSKMKFINAIRDTLTGIVLSGRSPEGFPMFV
jgi:hypothetical protein